MVNYDSKRVRDVFTKIAGEPFLSCKKHRELDVPFKRNGSLALAFTDVDIPTLQRLMDQGIKNGVTGLRILPAEHVLKMEPNLNPSIKAALWAPTGGITSPFEVTIAMAENAADNGVQFYLFKGTAMAISTSKPQRGLLSLGM